MANVVHDLVLTFARNLGGERKVESEGGGMGGRMGGEEAGSEGRGDGRRGGLLLVLRSPYHPHLCFNRLCPLGDLLLWYAATNSLEEPTGLHNELSQGASYNTTHVLS